MNRAYSVLTVKAMDDKKRTFTGIATTPSTDRMGDIVEPKGVEMALPLPLLWQHDSKNPIGWVRKAKVTSAGIEVECEVASIEDEGALKSRLGEYWSMLKAGLVRGLSIGFNVVESARIEGTYGYRYLKTTLLELSCVTIAANADCSVTAIKSIDEEQRAALGPPRDRNRPGASGQSQAASGRLFSSRSPKGKDTMKTLKELLDLQATRVARQTEITKAWEDQSHERTDEERDELDEIDTELKTLGDDIRMARMHARHAANAKGVDGSGSERGSASRGGMSFVKKADPEDKFPGQSYVRKIKAQWLAQKNQCTVSEVAEHLWGKSHPKLVQWIKAAVAGGGTGSGEWGAELAESDSRYTGDFIEFLYKMTVFDRLPLKEIPHNVQVKGRDGAATGYWVGQSKAIPVSAQDFSDVELTALDVAALCVVSNRLLRDASPAGDRLFRDALVEASAQRVDTTFLGAGAASAGVSPAGLLNGVTGVQASGTDAAAIRADIQSLYAPFFDADNNADVHLIMQPRMGKAISLLVNSLGQTEFPGIGKAGGTLLGDTVWTGGNVTAGNIIAIAPSDIYKIGDSGVQVSMSNEATIEMTDAPAGASDTPVAMASHAVSMFQTESTAFKVVRQINYAKRRSHAAQFIENAEYGGVVS